MNTCKKLLFVFFINCLFNPSICQDFEVAPVILNFDANPGEIQEKSVHIKNYGNKLQAYTATLSDFKVVEGERIKQKVGSSIRSLEDYITITPNFFKLNPNEDVYLNVVLIVPKDVLSTHWGFITIGPANEKENYVLDKQTLSTGIKIVPKIEIMVMQSPKTNVAYHSIIEDLTEIPSTIDSLRVFRTHIKNDGDKILHADVHLEYGIYETAQLIKLKGIEKTIYPGESVEFDLKINKNIITSKGQVALILDYGHNSKVEGSVIEIDP
tara:strand:- start:3388 stop:4191 length:804 start_codon:yes stop_codon:yes gene_type:complete